MEPVPVQWRTPHISLMFQGLLSSEAEFQLRKEERNVAKKKKTFGLAIVRRKNALPASGFSEQRGGGGSIYVLAKFVDLPTGSCGRVGPENP